MAAKDVFELAGGSTLLHRRATHNAGKVVGAESKQGKGEIEAGLHGFWRLNRRGMSRFSSGNEAGNCQPQLGGVSSLHIPYFLFDFIRRSANRMYP